jgi:hypothetical protein
VLTGGRGTGNTLWRVGCSRASVNAIETAAVHACPEQLSNRRTSGHGLDVSELRGAFHQGLVGGMTTPAAGFPATGVFAASLRANL